MTMHVNTSEVSCSCMCLIPCKNQCNTNIAQQVRSLPQNHAHREKDINDFATNSEILPQVKSSALRHPEAHGGSGLAAATVADLGFEPTLGATAADAKPVRRRKKTIEVGEELSAAGDSATRASSVGGLRLVVFQPGPRNARETRKGEGVSGGASRSLRRLGNTHGQPAPDIRANITTRADSGSGRAVGSGASAGGSRAGTKRNAITRDVLKQKGLSPTPACKYIKEHTVILNVFLR